MAAHDRAGNNREKEWPNEPIEDEGEDEREDEKEAALSRTALKMQKNIRKRVLERKLHALTTTKPGLDRLKGIVLEAERQKQDRVEAEREVDAESLHQLEVATLASSPWAKVKDCESLEMLIRHTAKDEQKHLPQITTPPNHHFWPNLSRHIRRPDSPLKAPSSLKPDLAVAKGAFEAPKSTPTSHEQSISIISDSLDYLNLTKADDNFDDLEEYQQSTKSSGDIGSEPACDCNPDSSNGSSGNLSAKLKAVKSIEYGDASEAVVDQEVLFEPVKSSVIPKIYGGQPMERGYVRARSASLLALFDQLEKQDQEREKEENGGDDEEYEEEDEERLGSGSSDSGPTDTNTSPLTSPTMFIKHLPDATSASSIVGGIESEDAGEAKTKAVVEDLRQAEDAAGQHEEWETVSDEEDWEVVPN